MNRQEKSLAIVHITSHDIAGGASKVAQRLSVSQRNRGHDSKMLVGAKRSSSEQVFTFPLEVDPYILGKCRNEGLLYYELQGSHLLINHPIIKAADIVHLHILHGGYFNPFSLSILSRSKPVIWTLHDMQAFTGHCAHSFDCERWKSGCDECPDLTIYPAIAMDSAHSLWEHKKLIYKHSRFQLAVPSQWLRDKIAMSILRDHPAELIPNGVETQIFRPYNRLEMRGHFRLPEDAILIGGIADHGIYANAFKGGRYAIQAVRSLREKMPNCYFISIGSGGNSGDPHVINIPRIEDESELARLYSTLDIYLLTSIAENCPLVVLEALACGVPVISFATGGVPELVRNKVDGYVVKPKEVSLLTKAMTRVIEDPRLREAFSLNARKRAISSFNHDLIAKKYENLYSRFLERKEERRKIDPIPIERLPKLIQSRTFINSYSLMISFDKLRDKAIVYDKNSSDESKRPLVSAIVSTYNSERFIRGCIEDLEAQTIAGRLEIIVVDSGSEQNEGEIVKEFQKIYSNIHFIRTGERETVYAAWNRGIRIAKGKYITNANTDDRHRKDAFERMVNVLEMSPDVALAYADVLTTETENKTFDHCTGANQYRWYDWNRNILLEKGCFMGPQPMWRREVHDLYGYFDDSLVSSGDYEFWLRISQTYEFLHIGIPLGLYLIRPESIEHNENETKKIEDLEIQRQYLDAVKRKCLIKFQPFDQVKKLVRQIKTIDTGELEIAIRKIEELAGRVAQDTQSNPYWYLKNILLSGASGDHHIELFFQIASGLILENTSWFKEHAIQHTPIGAKKAKRTDIHGVKSENSVFEETCGDVGSVKTCEVIYQGIAPKINSGRYQEAIRELEDLLNIYPEYALAHNDLGVLHYNQGDKGRALAHYEKAAQLSPENITFKKNLADFYYVEMGRIRDALRIYVDILMAHPKDVETLMITGHICISLHQFEDARVFYKRILEIEPWNTEAYDILHNIEQRTAQMDGEKNGKDEASKKERRSQIQTSIQKLNQSNESCREFTYEKLMGQIESLMLSTEINGEVISEALKVRAKLGPMKIDKKSRKTDTVSLCMIVKDEESHLAKCLSNIKPLVDEVIVVDTGSNDRTKDIASVFGARVYDFEWKNDYSEARNFSISHASGNWILILDADEIISPKDYDTFKNIVKKNQEKPVAYSFETRNYTFYANTLGWRPNDGTYPEQEAGVGWFPSTKVRLFQNAIHNRFQFSVHEMVDPAIKRAGEEIIKCRIPIHHYGEVNSGRTGEKAEAYYRIGLEKLDKKREDIAAIRELAVQAGNLKKWEESIILWEKVIAIEPGFAEAYVNMGTANWNLERYDYALEHAKKAIEFGPHIKEGHFNYAISSLLLGNAKEAVVILNKLAGKSPEYLPAQFMLGAAYCCDGRKEEGLRCFEKLRNTPVGPGLCFAFHDLAKRVLSAQKTDYAVSLLDAAIESRNSNEDVVALLNECLGI
jgi:glycosyltransferase involved in cell wall biosynthesis